MRRAVHDVEPKTVIASGTPLVAQLATQTAECGFQTWLFTSLRRWLSALLQWESFA